MFYAKKEIDGKLIEVVGIPVYLKEAFRNFKKGTPLVYTQTKYDGEIVEHELSDQYQNVEKVTAEEIDQYTVTVKV